MSEAEPGIPKRPKRESYRHGDLQRVLLEAGIELARIGGPEAVVLREATRRAGVVPNAAYRHFASREELLQAVRKAALSGLAKAMEVELAAIESKLGQADQARAHLRAVGTGYLRFAQAEPGLFKTIFMVKDDLKGVPVPEKAGQSGLNPFQLLGAALDKFVESGVMSKERRLGTEYLAWSAVHGLSMLLADGPLQAMLPAQREALGRRLLDMVEKGLT